MSQLPWTWISACAFGAVFAGPVLGDQPLSAIDWLSTTFDTPTVALKPDLRGDEAPVAASASVESVTVRPLGQPSIDGVGVVPPHVTGLPRALWAGSDVDQLRRLLADLPVSQLPAAHRLTLDLILAEAGPPTGPTREGALFEARVDALLARGALEEATTMLARAGALQSVPDPALFARAFDLTLLLGEEHRGCARLKAAPGLTPALPVRVFCLARNGDWAAAAVTLDTAAALGDLSAADQALLARFLDPELYEGTPPLQPTPPISPLTFRMFEALGEPIPTAGLPLAFAHRDLRDVTGWKTRIAAAERLTRAGALAPNALWGIYSERKAAASGGAWERVRAIQALDKALETKEPEALARALGRAWTEFQGAGLEPAFADIVGPRLREMALADTPAALAFQIGLLTPGYESVAQAYAPEDAMGRFLVALAKGAPQDAPAPDDTARAITAGFGSAEIPPQITRLSQKGQVGEALLETLHLLHSGARGEQSDLSAALAALRLLGLEQTARRVSLELMLLGPVG